MQANETLLELWIEALCAEVGELAGALIAASVAPHEANRNSAYRTALLAEGPVQGELYITVEADGLVQFTQLASGEPLDPEVPCDPHRVEAWRRLLASTADRVSARLTADFTDAKNSRCVLLLGDTSQVENDDPLSGEPGSRIQRWLLQAGQSKLAILVRARIEFPEELVPFSPTPSPDLAENSAGQQPKVPAGDQRSALDPDGAEALENVSKPAPEREEAERTGAEGTKRRRAFRDSDEPLTSSDPTRRLDLLLDIELEATLRFGAIEMPLREVLELGPGDVLSLDRHVQEPVELVVGDRFVARGEVVLIGGNFGLQVTEVAEPRRRLETIRCLF
jgi:flagellar motor switch protein FliN/FliY